MSQTKIDELQSKLELTAEALRRSDELATAGQLALEVMHDIRNPLEALRNLIYLTSLRATETEEIREYAKLAEEQVAIVIEIANSTLDFVKAKNRPNPVNLVSVAEAAFRIHQRTIADKKIHLVKDLAGDVIAPVCSGEMLQVISNLLTNALDALPPSGTIHVRLRKRQDEVLLLIADNGHGIPPEHVAEIFRPFFTTKQDRGTGLGLALSQKIVRRHGGTIRMRSSVRPGKSGTLFRISLPV